jgi:hypothetical protein
MNLTVKLKDLLFKHPVTILSILHVSLIVLLILIMKIVFHLPDNFFLSDDHFGGPYIMGKNFFEGRSSLLHQYIPPGIPALFSLLNFFPENFHPYLRIVISEIFTILCILLVFKIYSDILSRKAIIYGLMVALFNPLFLWSAALRSRPDIYMAVFLGLIIYSALKLINGKSSFHYFMLLFIVSISVFFKPVLFLIPLLLALSFLLRKKYKLVLACTLIFVISVISLKISLDIAKPREGLPYGIYEFMVEPIITDVFIHTGKLGFYDNDIPDTAQSSENFLSKYNQTMHEYALKYNNNPVQSVINYSKENAGILILSKILHPFFFISLSNTTLKTFSLLFLNSVILILCFINMKRTSKFYPEQISILVFTFLGYYLLYFLILGCARYFIPILIYISVFSGVSINNWITKIAQKAKKGG